jgi:raffinose synthase
MQHYHEALEGSAQTHFLGNLINCMSCANEMIYCALNSNVIRTSTDFWPNRPESHGLHLYTNAQVSLWVGEFFLPDWDMFQSGHPAGAYHAAARAVGGCPVYVSDKPDAHDFDLLRKLALPDGRVLRAPYPGKPTRDCLFHDPTREDVLLKIFNRNTDDMGILGAFHAKYHADGTETAPISGSISPADVEGLEGEQFAVYAHYAGELRAMQRADLWEITLEPLTAEIFTLVAIEEGIAPIGLKEMFNSAGAIEIRGIPTEASYLTGVKGGGTFLCYCEHTPAEVYLNDAPVAFTYDAETSRLEVVVPFEAESSVVEVWFEE